MLTIVTSLASLCLHPLFPHRAPSSYSSRPPRPTGRVIQDIADREGFGTVAGFTGHGIGKEFHMAPHIFHFRNNHAGVMRPGMVFTIEPILNATMQGDVVTLDDDWTVITVDGARSAQFEDTIVITEDGHDVMTRHAKGQFDEA